jgi:hypothetical protein
VHQVSDRFNSNERIFIQQPYLGTHVCVVTLERQLMSGSTFAVVITGGFRNVPVSQVCYRHLFLLSHSSSAVVVCLSHLTFL